MVEPEVILHSTVDQEISAPILSAFHRAENKQIQSRALFSAAEQDRDKLLDQISDNTNESAADVLWTDDILLMIELQRRGVLSPHVWKTSTDISRDLKAVDGSWCGFAATARVLIVNTDKVPDPADRPQSVDELADPRWQQRCAIATPTTGTAAIHAAVIASSKGSAGANEWFAKVASNAVILPTNSAVASAVAAGRVDWGLTDSNYAVAQQDAVQPIVIVFPDQGTIQPGTVRIPNVVAILATATHPVAAKKLADYLVLPITEERLAMSDAAQIPLSRQATFKPRVLGDAPVRWAVTDFNAAAATWQAHGASIQKLFAIE